MSRRSAFIVTSLILAGLSAGQGCPGFYEEDVAADNGIISTGESQTGNTDTGNSTAPSSIVEVDIEDAKFIPKSITISAGQAVRWTNHQFTPHAIRSGNPEDDDKGELFRSSSLGIGATFQHTFTEPGTYYYHCEYSYSKAGMRDASVIVVGSSVN